MVPSTPTRNRLVPRFVSKPRDRSGRGPRVDDENQVRMTGSIILALVWSQLVSALLFALAGMPG